MPQGATVKGQGDSGGMRGGTNAPYGNFILHLTSFLHGHPHLSGAHGPRVVHIPLAVDALWGKKKQEVTAGSLRRRLGGSSETHQEVLDLGPQHLELHQAQFVAAVFLWHQFRSRRLLTFTPSSLNRKSHRPHLPSTGSPGFTRRHRSMPRKQLGPPYWPDSTCSSGVTSSSERIHPAD